MASFTLFDGSTTSRTLADGEFGFIGQLGALATEDAAIIASGSVDVTVLGALHSAESNAISHDGAEIELYVGQLGAIGSAAGDSVAVSFTSSAFVSTDGSISSASDALDIRASDEGGLIDILNTGAISGASDGIVTGSGDEATQIVNRGSITGASGGVDHLNGDARLINRGDISGADYGYDGADGVDTVHNFGSILGGVIGDAGDDAVLNAGFIDRVDLGDGDDDYEGRDGSVGADVQGGAGADTLRGGYAEDLLRGGDDDDVLRGRGEDDSLRGDAGEDVLNGGRGDDALRGGANADVFRFAPGHGFDTILDLGGADDIDLTSLGLRSFQRSVRDAIEEARNGSVIDLSDDFGLTIFLVDVDADSLRGNDFLI